MTARILFMCPHSAGKSLAAATYFRAAAARAQLEVEIGVAGPDPDDTNMPLVEAELKKEGYTIGWQPKLVSTEDIANADLLVSIGCDHSTIPTEREIVEWDSPMISQDLHGSLQAIHRHAEDLAQTMQSEPS